MSYRINELLVKIHKYGISILDSNQLLFMEKEGYLKKCHCVCHRDSSVTHITACCEKGYNKTVNFLKLQNG